MPIKWKKGNFKPAPVIKRIASVRTVSDEGRKSYSGWVLDECLPTLYSMLDWPEVAKENDQGTLVWKALNRAGKELTPDTFIAAINAELTDRLATKEKKHLVLTTISLAPIKSLSSIKFTDCNIKFLNGGFPKKFQSHRQNVLKKSHLKESETPADYCHVIVEITAKSANAAFRKAMRRIDLVRAIMCLMLNSRMQLSFGSPSFDPINAVRLGRNHTVHYEDGTSATELYWYEPNFKPKSPQSIDSPDIVKKNIHWALANIEKSNFRESVISSLLMFVRGLDSSDYDAAFLKMWGALEMLTTPGVAEYDKLIRRTSFLVKETEYHRQVLEHLRSYRNASVHAGEESENAKIHCFQLQSYYVAAAWFFIRSGQKFANIADAGTFLDLPTEPKELNEQMKRLKDAIKFRKPS